MQILRNILHRRKPVQHELFAVDVLVQDDFQPFQNFVVYLLAGNKLPLVEAVGVVQQRFQLRHNDGLTKRVDPVLVFVVNDADDLVHFLLFRFRQKQRFVDRVIEKGVLLYGRCQRRIP